MIKKKTLLLAILTVILLAITLRPVRQYFKAFLTTLFSKEIVIYDNIPTSTDTTYRMIHIGEFESEQYLIQRTDSFQSGQDKVTGETWKYKIEWIYENEYFLYDSAGQVYLKNKIIDLTDSSYSRIYSVGSVGKKIEFKIKTTN